MGVPLVPPKNENSVHLYRAFPEINFYDFTAASGDINSCIGHLLAAETEMPPKRPSKKNPFLFMHKWLMMLLERLFKLCKSTHLYETSLFTYLFTYLLTNVY